MKILLNGQTLAYTDDGQGIPLVFIHGFPLSRGAWKEQIRPFQDTHRVITFDLPGFGESGQPDGAMTMSRYAGILKNLLDHLNTGPVILAGHSMGGYIALAFARKYPELLRALALVATKTGPDTPDGAKGRLATAGKVGETGTGVVIEAMAPKMVADQALVPEVRKLMESASPAGVMEALRGMAERPDSTDLLPTLKVPVWIVSGDTDALIPHAESERMAAVIPGSILTLIPGAGHLVAIEQHALFNAAFQVWLGTIR